MADVVTPVVSDVPAKKPRNGRRKALKETDKSSLINEANIAAQQVFDHASGGIPVVDDLVVEKENRGGGVGSGHSNRKKGKSKKAAVAMKEGSMEELMEMMEKLRIEKERTEEMLKEKDEILKVKEEEKESIRVELRKLQKLKEFKPTLEIPNVQSDKDLKQKKKGCPGRKRPSPPYTLWCKDQWNEIKKENPEAEFKEISNIVAAKWKNLSADQKKPYEDRYQAEKDVYLRVTAQDRREAEAMKLLEEEKKQKTAMELLQQYLQFKQDAEEDDKKKAKKEKDPLKPKQPMSAFFLFSNERRSALLAKSKSIVEAAKIAGEEWKGMNEKLRKPYEEMARQNKERYLKEMEAHKAMKEEEAERNRREEEENMKLQKQEALQLLRRKEKTQNIIKKTKEEKQKSKKNRNDDPNKPKKPASSFLMFSKETRKALQEERPGVTNSTLNALISVKWKELDEGERGMWNARAAEAMEEYKKEMEEYNRLVPAAAADCGVSSGNSK
ncbi:hypothetical protein MLD38_020737 [Melastoma candidum]|uniref:Uncharacterized protein n=1 Tax=Melastoma candidum TaxID=119954 RepID=A0ACB9QE76_9MYRT|nr:hypothetical protein MLD38_020737 [Melastoma candidum]